MKRACEVLPDPETGGRFSDAQLSTACADCGTEQTLVEMNAKEESGTTGYFCRGCDALSVVVRPFEAGEPPQDDSGYRINDWVLSTKADLFLQVGEGAAMQFPATPAYFELI